MLVCLLSILPASGLAYALCGALLADPPASGRDRAVLFGACCLFTLVLTLLMQAFVFGALPLTADTDALVLGRCVGFSGIAALMSPLLWAPGFGGARTRAALNRDMRRFLADLKRYAPYALMSARAELKAQVVNAHLSWMWWLIEPLCMMLIYAFVFGVVFRAAEPQFALFLFIGITFWNFFARNVRTSATVIRAHRGIITRIYLPKYILYLGKMFVNFHKMLFSLGIIVVMMLVCRVSISGNILFFPILLLILFVLTFAAGVVLMHWGVFINDLDHVLGIVLRIMMYVVGVFYNVAARAPAPFGELIDTFMPVTHLISAIRQSVLYCATPDWRMLAVWFAASLCLLFFGIHVVYENENTYVRVV